VNKERISSSTPKWLEILSDGFGKRCAFKKASAGFYSFSTGGSRFMAEHAKKNWEELARAARDEQDSEKLIVIVEELNRALDEQVRPRGESQRKTTGEESNVLQLV
jgi:hypothetical protein